MTDLEKFLELYRSVGVEPEVKVDDSGTELRLAPDDKLIEGYNMFYSSIEFDKNGKFICQGFWE